MPQCLPTSDPNSNWPFCPSVVPAALFAVLFGLVTIGHTYQAFKYRKVYCWVIVMASLWMTATYAIRELSVYNQKSSTFYSIWFIMILVGPLWINAFVYMCLARMVWAFLPNKQLAGVWAWKFGTYFVLLDVLAFLVQVAGASMASGTGLSQTQIMRGLHIYMGGVGLQQAFIIVFTVILFRFQQRFKRESPRGHELLPLRFIFALYAVLGLITVRIIFRLAEYSSGLTSSIPTHEAFAFVFDSLPMFIAVLLLNIFHPGRVMPGKENQIPSRKERKRMIKEGLLPSKKGMKGMMPVGNGSDTEIGLTGTSTPAPKPETGYGAPSYGVVEGYESYRHTQI